MEEREAQEAVLRDLKKREALRKEEAKAIEERVKIIQTHEQVARKVMNEKIGTIQADLDTLIEGSHDIELKHLKLIDERNELDQQIYALESATRII